MKDLASRVVYKETIFATMSQMAKEQGAINLSQGFPDFDGPDFVKDLATKAIEAGHNQYAPFMGHPQLRESISNQYQKNYNLSFDPEKEVTITCGATEAIFLSIMALIDPGDEVIVFEPFYDSYVAAIRLAGGIPIALTLRSPEFEINPLELESAINKKTKLIIINTPHNPTGHCLLEHEKSFIKDMVIKHDLFLICDEVYEHLTYDDFEHVPMASDSAIKSNVITISSFGKTFGLTGWKVGWVCANKDISLAIRMIHQFNTFSVATPLQIAFAQALDQMDNYLEELKQSYHQKRDYFFSGLKELGFRPIKPMGTYFIMCPISHLTELDASEYCMQLIREKKVATIPPSPFYLNSSEGEAHLRFCFAKKQQTLEKAITQLKG